jgi:hypothetical protein
MNATALAPGCATCHQEHRGASFDLTHMDDETCQVCHAVPFTSFANGHPEFSAYPYARGAPIAFDHDTHRLEGFSKANNKKEDRAFECTGCHVLDEPGHAMGVRGFDQMCATCHAEQIAANDGVVVLSIPGFEVDALEHIGEWPNEDETDLSSLTRLLLRGGASHAEASAEYWELIEELDPLDLSDLEPEELAAVDAYAWDLKQLTADLARGGQMEFATRVSRALGAAGANPALAAGQLPADTIGNARDAWFPNLTRELASRRAEIPVATVAEPPPLDEEFDSGLLDDRLLTGGWHRQDADMTLRYRPVRHEDEFMRTWLDVAAREAYRDEDARALLAELSARDAPGRCAKCHTIQSPNERPEGTAGPRTVGWRTRRGSADEHPAQRFSHAPHVRLLGGAQSGESSCTACHALVSAAATTSVGGNPDSRSLDFAPLRKQTCARCHNARGAGQSCLLCHNYHVGRFPAGGAPDLLAPD